MFQRFSIRLRDDAHHKVQRALRTKGIVNIIRLSEEIRLNHLAENIAREDIESLVMEISQLYGAPIEFDDEALTALDLPEVHAPPTIATTSKRCWMGTRPAVRSPSTCCI